MSMTFKHRYVAPFSLPRRGIFVDGPLTGVQFKIPDQRPPARVRQAYAKRFDVRPTIEYAEYRLERHKRGKWHYRYCRPVSTAMRLFLAADTGVLR